MKTDHRLLIADAHYQRVLAHVGGTPDERMAFLYCGQTAVGGRRDWLVRSVDLPDDCEYRHQGPARVAMKAEAVVGRAFGARDAAGFVDVHSHPFTDAPWPSETDERGAQDQRRLLADVAPDTSLLRLILGRRGAIFGQVFEPEANAWIPLSEVRVFGPGRMQIVRPINAPSAPAQNAFEPVDTRTAALVGEHMTMISASRVLVIGAGGVGSAVASQLAGLVNHIDLVDPDVVERHNLPRLTLAREGDVGLPKVDVLAEVLNRRINRVRVEAHVGRFPDRESERMFRAADFVFCCPDHHAARWAAASLAARTMRPLIEVGCGGRRGHDGSLAALGYHVRLQVPSGPCLACNGLDLSRLEDPSSTAIKQSAGYVEDDQTVQGELVTLTTRAASDAVDLFVRYMSGYAGSAPGHIYFDALSWSSVLLTSAYAPHPECSLCGAGADTVRSVGDRLHEADGVLTPPEEVANAAQ